MAIKEQLEERKAKKSRKPDYARHDSGKKSRITSAWRKPRGRQNKVRLSKRGYPARVTRGYGSPREVKGLVAGGLTPVPVDTLSALDALDPKREAALLSASLGDRKRELLLKRAKERAITLANITDVDGALAAIGERLAARKKRRGERASAKEKKKPKSIDEKVKKESAADPEAEKKAAEEEKRKVLTKKS